MSQEVSQNPDGSQVPKSSQKIEGLSEPDVSQIMEGAQIPEPEAFQRIVEDDFLQGSTPPMDVATYESDNDEDDFGEKKRLFVQVGSDPMSVVYAISVGQNGRSRYQRRQITSSRKRKQQFIENLFYKFKLPKEYASKYKIMRRITPVLHSNEDYEHVAKFALMIDPCYDDLRDDDYIKMFI